MILQQLSINCSHVKYFDLHWPKDNRFILRLISVDRSIKLSHIKLDYEEQFLRYSETFSWSGQRFEPRPKETHYRTKRHYAIVYRRIMQTYRSEPILGSFVVMDNMDDFQKYLTGTPRRPFNSPRRFYILAVSEIDENWQTMGADLLEKLWRSYGIGNVLLTAPCSNFDEKVYIYSTLFCLFVIYLSICIHQSIGYYEPFVVNNAINLSIGNENKYGISTWWTLNEFKFDENILRKFQNLNGFPLRISMFHRYPTAVDQRQQKLPEPLLKSYFSQGIRRANGFGGFDGVVLGNMAISINFTTIIVNTKEDYGYRIQNGSFVG